MNAATQNKHPLVAFKEGLDKRVDQLKHALPAHIPVERFMRVVLTAVQVNPKLLECTQESLWNACMRAAQDGLLPDGREGAIVSYGESEDGKRSGKLIAQWLPMIFGIRKKVRNSGEIATWEAHIVYEHDGFEYEQGDEPFIRHRPALAERGKIRGAYSIAKMKDGSISRDWMPIAEIESIRAKSRAKKGPWSDPVFYPEMCRKTVAKRHSKMLPMSSDLDDLMRRDDELYAPAGDTSPQVLDLGALTDADDDPRPTLHRPAPPPREEKPAPATTTTTSAGSGGSAGADAPLADAATGGAGHAPPADMFDDGGEDGDEQYTELESSIANALMDCRGLADVDAAEKLFADDIEKALPAEKKRIAAQFNNVREAMGNRADDDFPGDRR